MNFQAELERVLGKLWEKRGRHSKLPLYPKTESISEAQQAITKLVEDLIGENDKYNDFCDHCSDWDDGRNDLRQQLRNKLKGEK